MRRKKLDFGISFLSALRKRYIHAEEEAVDGEGVEDDMVIQGIQVEILNKKELIEEQRLGLFTCSAIYSSMTSF